MKTTQRHTKTPWKLLETEKSFSIRTTPFSNGNFKSGHRFRSHIGQIPKNTSNSQANALHIVKCVNNMDLIVKALSDILDSKTITEAKEYAEKTLRYVQDGKND